MKAKLKSIEDIKEELNFREMPSGGYLMEASDTKQLLYINYEMSKLMGKIIDITPIDQNEYKNDYKRGYRWMSHKKKQI